MHYNAFNPLYNIEQIVMQPNLYLKIKLKKHLPYLKL